MSPCYERWSSVRAGALSFGLLAGLWLEFELVWLFCASDAFCMLGIWDGIIILLCPNPIPNPCPKQILARKQVSDQCFMKSVFGMALRRIRRSELCSAKQEALHKALIADLLPGKA
jgi:hypothetical protein